MRDFLKSRLGHGYTLFLIYNYSDMSSQFDRIESRLQALIENSLNRLPWRNPQPRLASSLAAAVRNQLELDGDNSEPLPDCFNLFMNPDDCKAWESHPEWQEWLGKTIQELALESGKTFTSEPQFRILPDESAGPANVRVVLTYQEVSSSSTAVITPESDPLDVQSTLAPQGPYLTVNDQAYPIHQPVTNLGRREENDLVLNDPRVSREHAQIRIIHGECVLFDLNSTGGTYVNGRRITTHSLQPGDVITLAGVNLIFGLESPDKPRSSGTTPAQISQ